MKKNVEQLAFTTRLCQLLHVNEHAVCFAGIKDKRAVTFQYGSVRGVRAGELVKALGDFPNVEVSDFHYEEKGLEIGHLWGNHFVITLRDVHAEAAQLRASLQNIATDGFVNYFGTQRLGTKEGAESATACIGYFLLKKQYKECLSALLTPSFVFTVTQLALC